MTDVATIPPSWLAGDADQTAYADALALVIALNALLDQLCIRGLRALGTDELNRLQAQCSALTEIGATELSSNLERLADHLRNAHRDAAPALLRTRASIRVFERLLSLRMVCLSLDAALHDDDSDES